MKPTRTAVEHALRDAGLKRSEAEALLRGGYASYTGQDVEQAEFKALMKALRRTD